MSREAVIFGIAGTFFGVLVGWIIGSQQGTARSVAAPVAQTASSAPTAQPAAPPLDLQRVSALEQQAKAQPTDAAVRVELGNMYFDSERFDQAIIWYEAALKLNPNNVEASTDLAVCYYYSNDADHALQQIAKSLEIDPRHAKTLLNQGIIRAFGKQDLAGALESWEKVVQYAPGSPEAARAQQGIDGLKSAHGSGGDTTGRGGDN
jgi:cytochrome c-type biogenesis protein CcmH/NrfG